MQDTVPSGVAWISVGDIKLEVIRRGHGSPVPLLHGMQNLDPHTRVLDLLSPHLEIIAPSHPGFGHSPRPADFDTVYDLVHLYLALLESLPYDKVSLMGFSFGGWLAAELAVACRHRLERLRLVDALGMKISDRETPDLLDIFNTAPDDVQRRSWHAPEKWAPDFNAMSALFLRRTISDPDALHAESAEVGAMLKTKVAEFNLPW